MRLARSARSELVRTAFPPPPAAAAPADAAQRAIDSAHAAAARRLYLAPSETAPVRPRARVERQCAPAWLATPSILAPCTERCIAAARGRWRPRSDNTCRTLRPAYSDPDTPRTASATYTPRSHPPPHPFGAAHFGCRLPNYARRPGGGTAEGPSGIGRARARCQWRRE